jgi:hypothetical protein
MQSALETVHFFQALDSDRPVRACFSRAYGSGNSATLHASRVVVTVPSPWLLAGSVGPQPAGSWKVHFFPSTSIRGKALVYQESGVELAACPPGSGRLHFCSTNEDRARRRFSAGFPSTDSGTSESLSCVGCSGEWGGSRGLSWRRCGGTRSVAGADLACARAGRDHRVVSWSGRYSRADVGGTTPRLCGV